VGASNAYAPTLMDEAEDDFLAQLAVPKERWPQLASTNLLERLNGETKRRIDVVAIFPNEAAIVSLHLPKPQD